MQNLQNLSNIQGLGISKAVSQSLSDYIKSLSGLVAYYPMDETSGTVCYNRAPATAGTLDGTIAGATINQAGQVGKAYSFDGTGDKISIAHNAVLNLSSALSVFAIIRPVNAGGGGFGRILSKASGNNAYGLNVKLVTTGAAIRVQFNNDDYNSNEFIVFNNTYFVVATRNGTAINYYSNGSLVNAQTAINAINTNNTQELAIGDWYTNDRGFNGLMQHVGLVSRSLTLPEILRMAQLAKLV